MTSPSGPPARTTWTATASSWAKAPALSFWKRWNTPRSAAQKFTGNSVGYGISADAYHLTAPDPEGRGAARCMKMALEHAGMKPEDIDYVNTHGTSTPLGDICEIKAIKAVFGDHAKNGLLISSTKSMTGHLLGAAGGVELAACLMAMQDNIIPPTINVDNQDPECDLDCVPNKARETRVDAVLSNSFGFGGITPPSS